MQVKLERALGRAIRFLKKHKIRYAVIGGLALSQWGFDRFTDDIDLSFCPGLGLSCNARNLSGCIPY